MGLTRVKGGGIQPTILDPIQNLYTGSTVVFTVTVASKDTTHRYNGQGSSNGYKIDGKFAPFLVLTPGVTYKFDQADGSNSGHPLRFYKDAAKVTAYTTNVTTNGTAGSSGAYTQIVTGDATPTILYYQCSAHGFMGNAVQTNGLASSVPDDGSITTAKLAADAVDGTKIADDAVDNEHLAANSVRTEQIQNTKVTLAKLPLGTSSQDGKFLRANNGGQPTFESIPAGTTINNNANNRVITGSGSANTLEGEANLIFNGNNLTVSSDLPEIFLTDTNSSNARGRLNANGGGLLLGADNDNAQADSSINLQVDGSTKMSIDSSGNAVVGATSANGSDACTLNSDGEFRGAGFYFSNNIGSAMSSDGIRRATTGTIVFDTGSTERLRIQSGGGISFNGDTATANALSDYEEGTWSPLVNDGNGSNYTITVDTATYTKIGRQVTLNFQIKRTEQGSKTGILTMHNLPFAPAVSTQSGTFWVDHGGPTFGLGDIIGGLLNVSTSSNGTIYFAKPTDESGAGYSSSRYLEHGQWTHGRWIYGQCIYHTS